MKQRYAMGYLCFFLIIPLMAGDDNMARKANYQLAGRFAPYKIKKLLYSTSINPKWIEGTENFWYEWETSEGKTFYVVDPIRGKKEQIFDNDKIAAELTRISLDPWDAQHLPIEKIKFIDKNTLQFDVKSSQDDKGEEVIEEEIDEQKWDLDKKEKEKEKEKIYKKKVFHFEYKINTQKLRELKDWEAPDKHPKWANVSPDGETIVFARNHNLYMINASDYKKILDAGRGKDGKKAVDAIEKVTVNERQLTRDGEEYYSYAVFDRGDTDDKRKRDKGKRKRTRIYWAKDSKKFASIRSDQRKSKDLWVVHSVKNKRPKLETYKYDMAGDKNVTQYEIDIHDLATQSILNLDIKKFKDQRIGVYSGRQFRYPDSDKPQQTVWLAEDSKKFYFYRQSRDMHKVDVCVADTETGDVKVLFEEKLNTYVELQRLELLKSGDMLWWSERDGWGHIYHYGKNGKLKQQITSGPFSVRRIMGIDQSKQTIYFMANGREENEDPYLQHLYSVFIDGTRMKLLNEGNFDHRTSMGES
ncbi:MAG: S9 family peptidase, partial [Candidatus Marinimicrobia bacterium]|nr:S9 family peptidase [Candidatus Neomarinimicrobiota bacterium]